MTRGQHARTARSRPAPLTRLQARGRRIGWWAAMVLLVAAAACRHTGSQQARAPQGPGGTGEVAPATQGVPREILPGVAAAPAVWLDSTERLTLRARVGVRNTGRDSVRFALDGCPLEIRAYSTSDGRRLRAWSSRESRPFCPAVRRTITLAPGDTATLRTAFLVASIRDRAGTPPGRYAFTVSVHLMEPALTTPEYPVGELVLP